MGCVEGGVVEEEVPGEGLGICVVLGGYDAVFALGEGGGG